MFSKFWKRAASAAPSLSDQQLQVGIDEFRKRIHDLRRFGMSRIPPVKCPVPFGGWGFVEGRTQGIKVNKSLTLTEADNDMDFSEACVLLDGVPSLLLLERRGSLTVTLIAGQDYFVELFKPSGNRVNTVAELNALPPQLQKIMRDIFTYAYKQHVPSDIGVEKVLRYGE